MVNTGGTNYNHVKVLKPGYYCNDTSIDALYITNGLNNPIKTFHGSAG